MYARVIVHFYTCRTCLCGHLYKRHKGVILTHDLLTNTCSIAHMVTAVLIKLTCLLTLNLVSEHEVKREPKCLTNTVVQE